MVKTRDKFLPMEALLVEDLPSGRDWRYEPKWDGFRCLAFKEEGKVALVSKSGKPLGRYFPEVVAMLQALKPENFILDGELLVGSAQEGYSFSDLQMRLHPAESRIRKLAAAIPASYVVFDILMTEKQEDLKTLPFGERRAQLERFLEKNGKGVKGLLLSEQVTTQATAQKWLSNRKWRVDGIVAKNVADIYVPEERIMRKYKVIRTADCVVGGFRYGTNSREVGSLLLGLYNDEGLLDHVGFTSSIPKTERAALTKKLEKLVGKPGFTGKAPGGPSRWSTERSTEWEPLKPEMVVEVSFDHVSDERFRHGTKLLRFRPDKSPKQCKMEQITP
ncbi:MAG TPA: ATP-dependent DNA ligase [Patescibacteria group bacterium]|nr:ATP-dependent DNA ligase [Patescibacteria group bacterium]